MENKDSGFLGGGPKFNKAGVSSQIDPNVEEAIKNQGIQPHQIRAAIMIVVIVIAMAAVVYFSLPKEHNNGRGVDPTRNIPTVDRNF